VRGRSAVQYRLSSAYFAYTYPINGLTEPKSELSFGQFSTYIQDEYSVLDNLKVTGGLRIDLPVYFAGAVDNPALKEYSFRDGETVDLSTWPDVKVLWSPRLDLPGMCSITNR